ncbi:hypothetical protein EVAR_74325_1 [Eumeta japonica]|uniref:Uncharacterized protein n=1 Tax=Eumeta variegata TaxID=151549 RepID=A0A4C1SCR8_EUMVA|nr:hypothetical protein EVAR_74325_1 [Eumeta japonica]
MTARFASQIDHSRNRFSHGNFGSAESSPAESIPKLTTDTHRLHSIRCELITTGREREPGAADEGPAETASLGPVRGLSSLRRRWDGARRIQLIALTAAVVFSLGYKKGGGGGRDGHGNRFLRIPKRRNLVKLASSTIRFVCLDRSTPLSTPYVYVYNYMYTYGAHMNRERLQNRYCKQDEEQNRESRPDEDGMENGIMVGIECEIKIRTKSMFGIGIRNGADVRNQSGAF